MAQRFEDAGRDRNAGPTQTPDPTPPNSWVGVGHADHHPRNTGLNQRLGTGGRSAVVRARFQVDVDCRPADRLGRFAQRFHFGVRQSRPPMIALAKHTTVADKNGPHHGVRTRPPLRPQGQVHRAPHKHFISVHDFVFSGLARRARVSSSALRSRMRSLSSDMNSSIS